MSMITELIKRLRESNKLLNDAANVIEELSAKLQYDNMERSSQYYNGGWIPVSEREPKIADVYRVTRYYPNNVMNHKYIVDACFFDGSNTWYNDNRINHERAYADNVIAWQENPEPYKSKRSDADIQALEQEPCEDCVSYNVVLKRKGAGMIYSKDMSDTEFEEWVHCMGICNVDIDGDIKLRVARDLIDDALEYSEEWFDIPADKMTLEQARQAVKDLRKKVVWYFEQEPVLDKLRAEVKAMSGDIETIADALKIIDKYK